jgi:MtN3 and saliva related transmembrane protein
MNTATFVGSVAAIASTLSFAPQAWKVIKSRKTNDISTGMYLLTVGGFCMWTIYGILLEEWPLIITNSICLLMSGFILVMKLLSPRKKNEVADALDPATKST